ncbi:unnamed protein product [Thlaspi arvense]|uniref:Nudix hydrolase n=1 Tax=Thlaspi arvense TaxID=13288 RepID=A0AAU9T4M9_THLAR|nr:unnamed protein product [Thlaspi arvense]
MDNTAEQVILLNGEADNYNGVTVTIKERIDAEVFTERLRASLSHWRETGKKGIWIKLALGFANLVEPAVSEGFRYHHAEPDYLMLVSWISHTRDTIPANASHVVGVGALVLNKETQEILVVQERSGYFKDKNVWKLPTGVVDEGEDICTGVTREVEEETGIIADFVEVLSFRQSHKAFLNQKSDLFFLCALSPRTYEITEQKSEILQAKKKCEEDYLGFSTVETTTGTGKKSFIYCNADYAKSLNSNRGQASASL